MSALFGSVPIIFSSASVKPSASESTVETVTEFATTGVSSAKAVVVETVVVLSVEVEIKGVSVAIFSTGIIVSILVVVAVVVDVSVATFI